MAGGNQIAHGLWALSTGSIWGSGPGLGSPQSIPAGHTDFVLAAIGEELGFVGVVVVVALYALLSWRCLRVAARAPGDYTAFLATGVALALVVQAFVIGSGLLGLVPLSGVVTPFLSLRPVVDAGELRSPSAIVLAVARRRGPVRHAAGSADPDARHRARRRSRSPSLGRAAWVQVVQADDFATASSLSEQADGGYRFEYNPRLIAAARQIERGHDLRPQRPGRWRRAGRRRSRRWTPTTGRPALARQRGCVPERRALLSARRRALQRARRLGPPDELGGAQFVVPRARQRCHV